MIELKIVDSETLKIEALDGLEINSNLINDEIVRKLVIEILKCNFSKIEINNLNEISEESFSYKIAFAIKAAFDEQNV